MSVDGIGGGGRRPVGGAGTDPVASAGTAAVSGSATPGAAAPSATTASPALERLSRGEIGIGEYLDGRVAEAVKHLEGRVPAAQLDFVKQALRAEMSTDPVLVELLRRTTGAAPSADAD